MVVVDGYVALDQTGAADEADNRTWLAVAVPVATARAEDVEYTIPPLLAVKLALVPPLERPKVPVISLAKLTADQVAEPEALP